MMAPVRMVAPQLVAQPDDEPAGDEGAHGALAEIPKGARDQAFGGLGLGGRLRLGEEGSLYEVEVPQHADPGHAENEMAPPEQEEEAVKAE
jgi:hypothetical protein